MTQASVYTTAFKNLNKNSNFKIVLPLCRTLLPTWIEIPSVFDDHSFTSLCFKVEQLKDHRSAHFLLPGNNNIVFSLHCSFSFPCLWICSLSAGGFVLLPRSLVPVSDGVRRRLHQNTFHMDLNVSSMLPSGFPYS